MIVIIEGSDRVGKTTLAKEFVKRGFTYMHFGPPKPDEHPLKQYSDFIKTMKPYSKYVFDRFHLGEFVYSRIYNRPVQIGLDEIKIFERSELHAPQIPAIVVLAKGDPEDIKSKILFEDKISGPGTFRPEKVEECLSLFNWVFDESNLPGLCYQIGDSMSKVVFTATRYLRLTQEAWRQK